MQLYLNLPFYHARHHNGISDYIVVLKGHDFSRAVTAAKSAWALAPEGMMACNIDLIRA
jgi:hypothetical protein